MKPIVSIGIVNCNRLHYLRSQVASLRETLDLDASRTQLIIVDNASSEPDTQQWLDEIEADSSFLSVTVIRRALRDPHNEFAAGLNTIADLAEADVIIPLQGDSQFIRKFWLGDVLTLCERADCGCVVIDAQRRATLTAAEKHMTLISVSHSQSAFEDRSRPPVAGAADVAYPRRILKRLRWSETNGAHEGGADSETAMLRFVETNAELAGMKCFVLASPAMLSIQTDARGTNARVRGDKRYGTYFRAPSSDLYYEIKCGFVTPSDHPGPVAAEDVIINHPSVGWTVALGPNGEWLKNPIRPETALSTDWVIV